MRHFPPKNYWKRNHNYQDFPHLPKEGNEVEDVINEGGVLYVAAVDVHGFVKLLLP